MYEYMTFYLFDLLCSLDINPAISMKIALCACLHVFSFPGPNFPECQPPGKWIQYCLTVVFIVLSSITDFSLQNAFVFSDVYVHVAAVMLIEFSTSDYLTPEVLIMM